MAHSIKIGSGKKTVYSSVPTINAKAIEENSRVQLVPVYAISSTNENTYESLGLIEGKTYVVKYTTYGEGEQTEFIKATYDSNLGMIVCASNNFYIGDTESHIDSGWDRECLSKKPVLFFEKSIPFATATEARSLGIFDASVGQIVQISAVGPDGSITEWQPVYGDSIVFKASGGSTKKFKLSIDSSGVLTVVEAT